MYMIVFVIFSNSGIHTDELEDLIEYFVKHMNKANTDEIIEVFEKFLKG